MSTISVLTSVHLRQVFAQNCMCNICNTVAGYISVASMKQIVGHWFSKALLGHYGLIFTVVSYTMLPKGSNAMHIQQLFSSLPLTHISMDTPNHFKISHIVDVESDKCLILESL